MTETRMTGKIYHLGDGWGFISSPELKYTRFFFHWTTLLPDTLNFNELKKGMKVEFEKKEFMDDTDGKTKFRAIKVRVLEEEKENERA